MFVIGEGKSTNITFSRPIHAFDKSADQGCPICWIIASIGRSHDDSVDPTTRISLWLDAYRNLRLLCNVSLHDVYIPEENLPRAPNQMMPALESIEVRADISSTAWSESAQKIRTRLHSKMPSVFGQYTALSYCWGSDQPLKTTSTNIKYMTTTGLRLSELPPTFVDAVHVTRSLGFQYPGLMLDELQWVCKTSKACECALPDAVNSCHLELQAYCDGTFHDQLASTELALQAGYEWCSAVGDYSRRRLTRADDKLPAISGIASKFGAKMGFQYVAGLWAEDIVQGLAWSLAYPVTQPPAPLPNDYRAPSFSWASINDGVFYTTGPPDQEGHWIPYCSLVDAGTKVPGQNPFGKVIDAWATIRGPVSRGFIDLGFSIFRSDDAIAKISDFYLVLGKSPRDSQKYERIGSCEVSHEQPIPEHHSSFTTQTITIL
ncbi:hypothetical protein LA080_013422 [Diaporthe eres]|nr:hypothetical protein LA080_013422 [Diaporthe eres]